MVHSYGPGLLKGVVDLINLDNEGMRIQVFEALALLIPVSYTVLADMRTYVHTYIQCIYSMLYVHTLFAVAMQVAKEAIHIDSIRIVDLCTQVFLKCSNGKEACPEREGVSRGGIYFFVISTDPGVQSVLEEVFYAYSVKEPIGELNLKRALDEDTGVFSSFFSLLSSSSPLGQTAVSGNSTLHQ